MSADPTVEVIYIAFSGYGLEPVDRFLASYRRYAAGCPHVLTVARKGFADPSKRERVEARCVAAEAQFVDVPDGGLDIGTYFHAVRRSRADILCLLNTNAEILGEYWLRKMVNALQEQGGGAVSATGSWESLASDQLRLRPNGFIDTLRWAARFARLSYLFPAFPNPHLRTNALVIERNEFVGLSRRAPKTKEQAWRFESGRSGLSARLRQRGLPLRIVGRNGRAYDVSDWNHTDTFWQGEQSNLLVADNQTRRYASDDVVLRTDLTNSAWESCA